MYSESCIFLIVETNLCLIAYSPFFLGRVVFLVKEKCFVSTCLKLYFLFAEGPASEEEILFSLSRLCGSYHMEGT